MINVYSCYERLQPYKCKECDKEINENDPGVNIDINDMSEFQLHEGCAARLMNALMNFLEK